MLLENTEFTLDVRLCYVLCVWMQLLCILRLTLITLTYIYMFVVSINNSNQCKKSHVYEWRIEVYFKF